MFLGPIEIDVTVGHRPERSLHPDRAEIDVAENKRDEQHTDHGVEDLRQLHVADGEPGVEREQQHEAAYDHRSAGDYDNPVQYFLAGIELVGGRVRAVRLVEHAAALLEPLDVRGGRQIATDPHHEHQYDAQRET